MRKEIAPLSGSILMCCTTPAPVSIFSANGSTLIRKFPDLIVCGRSIRIGEPHDSFTREPSGTPTDPFNSWAENRIVFALTLATWVATCLPAISEAAEIRGNNDTTPMLLSASLRFTGNSLWHVVALMQAFS